MDVDTGTEQLLARTEDGIGWLTFNNPARHNAMSLAMQRAVPRALAAFEADDEVRVIVVSGAGERAFVSGADISEFGEKRTSVEAWQEYDEAADASRRSWAVVAKPVIAMIRGYCIGGGLLVALDADIRVCSEGSQFGVPAARLGLGYGMAGVEKLLRFVNPASAAEILLSGRRVTAEEALRIGLVNRVVPADELEAAVVHLAASIRANAPLTVAACKRAIREAANPPGERDVVAVDAMVEACFRSEDYVEGQRAFLEKRAPQFRGR